MNTPQWSEKELQQAKDHKRRLADDVIGSDSIEYQGEELRYDIVLHTASALGEILVENNWMAAYPAAEYMRMTDAIHEKYRPLIAMIEAYDMPRMKMREDDCCSKAIENAIFSDYSKNNLYNTDVFHFLDNLSIMYQMVIDDIYSMPDDERSDDHLYKLCEFEKAVERMKNNKDFIGLMRNRILIRDGMKD